jgi:competence protein ComEC
MRAPVTDLRLLPAAVACWAASLLAVRLPTGTVVPVLAMTAVVVVVAAWPGPSRSAARMTDGSRPHVPDGADRSVAGRHRTGAPGRAGQVRGHLVLTLVVCMAALVSAGSQRTVRDQGPLPALTADRATARVAGTIASEPVRLRSSVPWASEDRYRVDLDAEHVSGGGRAGPVAASVLVLGGASWRDLRFGSRVETLGSLEPAGTGNRAAAVLVVRGEPRVLSPPGAVDRRVERVRRGLLAVSERLPPDQRGLVPGAAIGDTSRIPADLDAAMRKVGLTHVTAVSGAHFTIVGAAVLGLAAVAGTPRVLRAGALAVAMSGFVLLVHPTPSVLRAAAMGAVGVSALVLGRPARAVPALAATVLTLLVVDPWLATSVGFTLSVVATAGIVLLSRPLAAGLSGVTGQRAARVVAVPLAAQLACGPVVVLLAPALPTYAVPANVVVAPAIVPATILGVLAALVAPWWTGGAEALAQGSGWATWWVASVARLFAGLPGAQVPWPSGPWGPVLLAVATTGVVLAILRMRRPDGST